jgi:hypothetical protein
MSVFKDDVYDEMDDLTKLIEPFEYAVNTELSLYPDEFELTAEMLIPAISGSWGENYMSHALEAAVANKASELELKNISREIMSRGRFVTDMFEFKWEVDEEDGKIVFNASTGVITGGRLFVAKKKVAVEDSDIEKRMEQYIYNAIDNGFFGAKEVIKGNLNEIATLFGAKKAREQRSWRNKVRELALHFAALVKDRKLVIKDFDLFKRFASWIIAYIKNGSLPAMSNIARLKIMMRSGNPIYSIKEEPV